MTTIVVSGALANKVGHGGEAWVRLNWVLGLRRLGFQVYFIEQIGRDTCRDAAGRVTVFADCANLAYFKQITEQFGLAGSAALIYENGEQSYGLNKTELEDIAASAALLVNISGHLRQAPLLRRLRRKVYIDIDPGFTQFWHADKNVDFHLANHDFYFTVGENIGVPTCCIPTGGIHWRRIRPPVVLEHWPVADEEGRGRFTTVANWRGPFGAVAHEGKTFGVKLHEFRKFIELPERAPGIFEIALNIHPAEEKDMALLHRHGWQLVDPLATTAGPADFRRYIQTSAAEFSVAQGIYVDTESGWFSDRTVHYLASGKPALVQDTGFSRNYPVGAGLVPFRTLAEAVNGAGEIRRDYERHSGAARALAEEYFDSDKVLGRLLEEINL